MKRYRVYESHLVDAAAPIGYGHHAGVEVVKHADAQEAIGHYQAEVFKLTQQLDAAREQFDNHERLRTQLEREYQQLQADRDALKAQLATAENELCTAKDQIPPDMDGDSLSVALMKLGDARRALQTKCGELEKQCDFYTRQNLALLDRWSNGYTVTVEQERDAAIASLTACRAQETWLRKGCSILIEQTSSTYFKQDDARLAQVMEWRNSEPQAQPHAGEG
jgi:chromosome segregation ATPase